MNNNYMNPSLLQNYTWNNIIVNNNNNKMDRHHHHHHHNDPIGMAMDQHQHPHLHIFNPFATSSSSSHFPPLSSSLTTTTLFSGDQEDEEDEEEEPLEELGAMKEMMYKIAAMQPVDIDPATVKKPKRRNVRISDDPQSVAARHRRERISERIRILQRLVPGGTKMDTASMLDEAIRYVKFLKRQIRLLNNNPGNPPPPSQQDQASQVTTTTWVSPPLPPEFRGGAGGEELI